MNVNSLEKIKCPLCTYSHLNIKLEICHECYFKLPQENRDVIMDDFKRVNSEKNEDVKHNI